MEFCTSAAYTSNGSHVALSQHCAELLLVSGRVQGYKKQVDESPLLTVDDSRCLFANVEEIYLFSRSVELCRFI